MIVVAESDDASIYCNRFCLNKFVLSSQNRGLSEDITNAKSCRLKKIWKKRKSECWPISCMSTIDHHLKELASGITWRPHLRFLNLVKDFQLSLMFLTKGIQMCQKTSKFPWKLSDLFWKFQSLAKNFLVMVKKFAGLVKYFSAKVRNFGL